MSRDQLVRVLIGLGVGLALTWLILIVAMAIANRRRGLATGGLASLLPRTLQLLGSLARDKNLPRDIRWRLGAAILYCGQPINVIPDWIPVIGFADNVVVISWALRSVVRRAGFQAVESHWKGTPEGLAQLYRALRVGKNVSDGGNAEVLGGLGSREFGEESSRQQKLGATHPGTDQDHLGLDDVAVYENRPSLGQTDRINTSVLHIGQLDRPVHW
jgi:uncharacterized membrane protein YkvA (DUF1232 family)